MVRQLPPPAAAVKGDHGTLALTDLSWEVMHGERQVTSATIRPGPRPAAGEAGHGGRLGAAAGADGRPP